MERALSPNPLEMESVLEPVLCVPRGYHRRSGCRRLAGPIGGCRDPPQSAPVWFVPTAGASPVDKESFESHIVNYAMEGGFTAEELQAQHPSAFQAAVGALTLAMTLEAQAVGLYLRYAEKSENVEVEKILYPIADEEKVHLNAPGEPMERKF